MTETGCATTLLEELRLRVVETPDALAILAPGRLPVTFAALWERIESFAGCGLGSNDVAAAALQDDVEMLCAALGVSAPAGFAPLDPNLPAAEARRRRPAGVLSTTRPSGKTTTEVLYGESEPTTT